jgi:hypothetical protein
VEPIIGIQWLSGLGEHWGIGVLEIPKLVLGLIIAIATIVVVVGGNLGEVLECGEVSLVLGTCGFTFL